MMDVSSCPRISIVIPVYNRQDLVGRSLESAFAQTERPLEVIVVDNNSTDNTVAAVTKWAMDRRLRPVECVDCRGGMCREWESDGFRLVLTSEKTPGASAARNRGLALTHTRGIYFLDSDDVMKPGLAETAADMLERGNDIVIWKAEIVKDDRRCKLHFHTRGLLRNHMLHAILSTQKFAVSTDFLRRAGGWNNDAMVWNDWELGVRLLLNNPRLAFYPHVMAEIFPQKESITGTSFKEKAGRWEHTLDIVEAHGKRVHDREVRDSLLGLTDYRRMLLGAHYEREGNKTLGRKLLEESLASGRNGWLRRLLLRFLYRWTAAGGRGAYLFWR